MAVLDVGTSGGDMGGVEWKGHEQEHVGHIRRVVGAGAQRLCAVVTGGVRVQAVRKGRELGVRMGKRYACVMGFLGAGKRVLDVLIAKIGWRVDAAAALKRGWCRSACVWCPCALGKGEGWTWGFGQNRTDGAWGTVTSRHAGRKHISRSSPTHRLVSLHFSFLLILPLLSLPSSATLHTPRHRLSYASPPPLLHLDTNIELAPPPIESPLRPLLDPSCPRVARAHFSHYLSGSQKADSSGKFPRPGPGSFESRTYHSFGRVPVSGVPNSIT
ncbi:hypothetical protein OF83DRAFT_1208120 [Amylostereum chailletii]|nr:hypothetical protein OF83DRAFT_1208120 [Amylostereum chailletii]